VSNPFCTSISRAACAELARKMKPNLDRETLQSRSPMLLAGSRRIHEEPAQGCTTKLGSRAAPKRGGGKGLNQSPIYGSG
jgi:hypothetical protein